MEVNLAPTFTCECVTYSFYFDRDDPTAPLGHGVEDVFRKRPNPQPWRVTKVEVVRYRGEPPTIHVEGVPVAKSGKADRRKTFSLAMFVSDEVEQAFIDAANPKEFM